MSIEDFLARILLFIASLISIYFIIDVFMNYSLNDSNINLILSTIGIANIIVFLLVEIYCVLSDFFDDKKKVNKSKTYKL